jgi:hypothetical protein
MDPSRTGAVRRVLKLGSVVEVSGEKRTDSETWLSLRDNCWVERSLTAEFDREHPEVALVSVADHVLGRNDATFEELVAADNLLVGGIGGKDLSSSGLLQYRQLQIFERLAEQTHSKQQISQDPLKVAWLIAHRDVVRYYEPDGAYFVPVEVYWSLHDRYPREPWSEELAWAAAQLHVPSDACTSDCVLDKIERTWAQYWKRYPDGRFVKDAIEKAIPMIDYASSMSSDGADLRPIFERLRRSLDPVPGAIKAAVMNRLNDAPRE